MLLYLPTALVVSDHPAIVFSSGVLRNYELFSRFLCNRNTKFFYDLIEWET
jgi:hypothetical protein